MQKVEDINETLEVTISALVKGANQHVYLALKRLCDCNLQQEHCQICEQTGIFTVYDFVFLTVVPGMRPGQRIRRQNEGNDGVNMLRGDVVITIELNDEYFTRGDDIFLRETVYKNFLQVNSRNFEMTLPEGLRDVPVRVENMESLADGMMVVRGLGLPIPDTDRRGNLYIKVEIKVPKHGGYLGSKIARHITIPRDEIPMEAHDGILYTYEDADDVLSGDEMDLRSELLEREFKHFKELNKNGNTLIY